jgi:hypothetical protein
MMFVFGIAVGFVAGWLCFEQPEKGRRIVEKTSELLDKFFR